MKGVNFKSICLLMAIVVCVSMSTQVSALSEDYEYSYEEDGQIYHTDIDLESLYVTNIEIIVLDNAPKEQFTVQSLEAHLVGNYAGTATAHIMNGTYHYDEYYNMYQCAGVNHNDIILISTGRGGNYPVPCPRCA